MKAFTGTFIKDDSGTADAVDTITGVPFQGTSLKVRCILKSGADGSFGHAIYSEGMTDGTDEYSACYTSEDNVGNPVTKRRHASKLITLMDEGGIVLAEGTFDGWTSDGFKVKWPTNNASAYVIHYTVTQEDNAKLILWTAATAIGIQEITGVGFQGDYVEHLSANIAAAPPGQGAIAIFSRGMATSDTERAAIAAFSQDAEAVSETAHTSTDLLCLQFMQNKGGIPTSAGRGDFDSWTSDGFKIEWITAGVPALAYRVASLVHGGGAWKVGAERSPAATGTQDLSATFTPVGIDVMHISASAQTVVPSDEVGLGFGSASDASEEAAMEIDDEDNQNFSDTNRWMKSTRTVIIDPPDTGTTPDGEAQLDSFLDEAGARLDWIAVPSTRRWFYYVLYGDAPPGGPSSFVAIIS